jgi:hypothetical protein
LGFRQHAIDLDAKCHWNLLRSILISTDGTG